MNSIWIVVIIIIVILLWRSYDGYSHPKISDECAECMRNPLHAPYAGLVCYHVCDPEGIKEAKKNEID